MNALDLSRWQFGITTVYHFIFVPLTIGLSLIVAGLQTAWYRTRKPEFLRQTHFFGKLFLINFAMGVVTGIVQEFQFGMNWSQYSRFVGDVFGVPLAMEGLLAFFLESTFLGLWIFGWDRLPKKAHLATIWLTALGSNLSMYFILAANAWMKHPVGYAVDHKTGQARLTDIWAVLTQWPAVVEYLHTFAGSLIVAGAFVAAVSAYRLLRTKEIDLFRPVLRAGLAVTLIGGALVMFSGDQSAKLADKYQPMKLASAEALWDTEKGAGFSLFAVGDVEHGRNHINLQVPDVLSFLATGHFDGTVQGINQLQAQYATAHGPGDYTPIIGVTYWSFRLMMGFGMSAVALAAAGLWLTRRRGRLRRLDSPWGRRFLYAAVIAAPLPFAANIMGWLLSEIGRQPWTVQGELLTAASVSPGVSLTDVAISLTVFTLLYGSLAVIEGWLIVRHVKKGPQTETPAPAGTPAVPTFSY
jgi:cytochrome bd ubiquinol oxidase subunit I